jgi:hypothetical protein
MSWISPANPESAYHFGLWTDGITGRNASDQIEAVLRLFNRPRAHQKDQT